MPPRPGTGTHIGEVNYAEIYRVAFNDDPAKANAFIDKVKEAASTKEAAAHRAKLILYQAARMVWLADQMDRGDIAYGRPAVQILFFIITAEAVAKLHADFHESRRSAEFVKRFFEKLCTPDHRKRLSRAFSVGQTAGFLSSEKVVDLLYDVRCRLAHEGRYFDLVLPNKAGERLLTIDWKQVDGAVKDPARKKKASKGKTKFQMPKSLVAHITVDELRQIILEGAVEAAKALVSSLA